MHTDDRLQSHSLSGQTCVCANRIFVHEKIYDAFAEKLAVAVKAFKVGNGAAEGTTHGPLIHAAAVNKVQSHVEDAKAKGAKVLLGGAKVDGPGFFFQVSSTMQSGHTPLFADFPLLSTAHRPHRGPPLRCRRGRDFR